MLIQRSLELTATLYELPAWETCLEITCLGKSLTELFENEVLLPGVILTENGEYRGMISRPRFFELMSRPYSRGLFSGRSLKVLYGVLESEILILSENTSIVQATQVALQRSQQMVYEPLLVKSETEIYRVLDFHQLLLAYSQIPDLALRRVREAEQETRIVEADFLQLQSNYTHYLQTEKMAALGQLVAGVAHEINNPVNFICGNLTYAEGYLHGLLELISLYQDSYPTPSTAIRSKLESLDLEFIKKDLPSLLISLKTGTERIQQIVHSLRNFSRLDEAEYKAVDIHEGIDSTLMILKSRFKATSNYLEIEVIKNYGELPLVECYAGRLNQVFMNILANAIDAIEEANSKQTFQESTRPGQIKIRTTVIDLHWVQISIADNGIGIPEAIKQKIFNPFFTTKPVGKGTGMGMSISYQIITETHQGRLQCFSVPGEGTEVVIQIPVQQQARAAA